MSSSSPLAQPEPFIRSINGLSSESLKVDSEVDTARRDAENLVNSHGNNFQILGDLRTSTADFSRRWVHVVSQSRDAASAIAAWYTRFHRVFLSLIFQIQSEADRDEVLQEFNRFLSEDYPSNRFQLDSIAGLKRTFNDIEALIPQETRKTIQALEAATGPNWKVQLEQLQRDLGPVKTGVEQIAAAFVAYAVTIA